MAITIIKTVAKAGRSYKVDGNGAGDVSLKYQVVLSAPLPIDELPTSFTGVPAIGSKHPNRPGLYALSYDVSQPDANAKHTLDVVVKYGPADITVSEPSQSDPGETVVVTEWGWDDGTGEKELTASIDTPPVPVLNSAGDPFDSAPTVYVPTPTFTKTIRCSRRKTYSQYLCRVNSEPLTIGDMACAAGTLLCSVAERKLIGETLLPYEYTVHLRYRSNKVPIGTGATVTEVGWDAAIVDAGMREIDGDTGKLKLIQVPSLETGTMSTVTSPELLNGSGIAISRSSGTPAQPVILWFKAYDRATFPSWFYSEPPTPTPDPEET